MTRFECVDCEVCGTEVQCAMIPDTELGEYADIPEFCPHCNCNLIEGAPNTIQDMQVQSASL